MRCGSVENAKQTNKESATSAGWLNTHNVRAKQKRKQRRTNVNRNLPRQPETQAKNRVDFPIADLRTMVDLHHSNDISITHENTHNTPLRSTGTVN